MPRKVVELCWQGSLGRHREIWMATPHCLLWCLWRERNARTFEDCERNILDLKLLFYRLLYDWMRATSLFSLFLYWVCWSLSAVILWSLSIFPVYSWPFWSIKFCYLSKKKKKEQQAETRRERIETLKEFVVKYLLNINQSFTFGYIHLSSKQSMTNRCKKKERTNRL